MTAFGADSQPTGQAVSGVKDPAGAISFSNDLDHLTVGSGWATWSNNYTGDVYWEQGASAEGNSVTITMPANTVAFYLYAEPDPFSVINISATTDDGTTSGKVPVNGDAGAHYFGFYTDGTTTLQSITVSSGTDFAIGEFGINTSGPAAPRAQVLFLHGVTQSYIDATPSSDKLFSKLLDQLRDTFGAKYVNSFDYYQDKGDYQNGNCNTPSQGDHTPPTPPSWVPYDGTQNGLICDSQGDLGQNAVRLDAEIQRLYHSNGNVPVILMGYSMGGETIRSFLSYSTHVGDGVATSMVDSVVLMHGVEQGSWLAYASLIHSYPLYGPLIGDLIGLAFPNPNRPATQQFVPLSQYMLWVDSSSDRLPNIPMYNTWGDERVTVQHCFLPFGWACVSSDIQNWGDVVLMPGTDNPTQTPVTGGEKFLPGGRSATHWEWAETGRIYWDPLNDPSMITAFAGLYNAPEMHTNYPSTEAQLTVADCQTGKPIAESDELFRVISARMNGQTYACKP